MTMSERNNLLIVLQDDFKDRIETSVKWHSLGNQTEFTIDEIKGALQHVLLTYGKID